MRSGQDKNTETGATSCPKRRSSDIVGDGLKDPFYDSYREEGLACSDILNLISRCEDEQVTIAFSRLFLKKLVRSHLLFIKEMEKFI